MRGSGIDVVGRVPWGTHFCQFYETAQDLTEVLVPYFRAGLEADEFCMWVTSPPLEADQAASALRAQVRDLDKRLAEGQIEILDYSQWYTLGGRFDANRVLKGWADRLEAAQKRGWEGLRLTGNTFWLEPAQWDDFTRYEAAVNDVIGRYRMLALCTYPLGRCGAVEILDVLANHEFALIRRGGQWEVIQSARLRQAEAKARSLARFPEENPSPVLRADADGELVYANPPAMDLLKGMGWAAPSPLPEGLLQPFQRALAEGAKEFGWVAPGGRVFVFAVARSLEEGLVNLYGRDRTDRYRAEQALREAKDQLEIKVLERTAELEEANQRLKAENQERLRTEQSLRLEEARLDALLHLGQMTDAPLSDITNLALEQAIALTHSKIGFLGFLNEDETIYNLHSVSRNVVKDCRVASDPVRWPVRDAGIWADAIRQRRTVFVNDYSQPHPHKKGLPPGHLPIERFMVVPILEGERIVAVAGVGNKASDYDKSDERQVALLLRGMQGYVQRNRAREELQKAHGDLEDKVRQRTAELAASAAALLESQNDLKRAQQVGQIGSWRLDTRRNVLTWSDENHRIFGVPKGTPMTYEAFLATVHPDDRAYVHEKWSAGLRGEPYDIEHRIVTDGRVKWVREKAYLEFDQRGWLLGGFGITQDITERKASEEALRKARDELEERVRERTAELAATNLELHKRAKQLARLASELTLTEQRERRRLARVLHDHLQQLLVGAKFGLQVLGRRVGPHDQQASVLQVQELVDESIRAARSLTVDLSPPILHEAGLAAGLEWLARWMAEKHGLLIHLDADPQTDAQREDVRILLFEAVRELLLNVVKHARVTRAHVTVAPHDGDWLRVVVRDDGVGFDPAAMWAATDPTGGGFGLFSIRERLALLGGRLQIQSAPQQGATFTLVAPMREPQGAVAEAPGRPAGAQAPGGAGRPQGPRRPAPHPRPPGGRSRRRPPGPGGTPERGARPEGRRRGLRRPGGPRRRPRPEARRRPDGLQHAPDERPGGHPGPPRRVPGHADRRPLDVRGGRPRGRDAECRRRRLRLQERRPRDASGGHPRSARPPGEAISDFGLRISDWLADAASDRHALAARQSQIRNPKSEMAALARRPSGRGRRERRWPRASSCSAAVPHEGLVGKGSRRGSCRGPPPRRRPGGAASPRAAGS